jgi:hypothetical protein
VRLAKKMFIACPSIDESEISKQLRKWKRKVKLRNLYKNL